MTLISGILEKITYLNEKNGFVVAKIQEKGKRGLTTIVGNLPGIHSGESLRLTGKWVQNRRFGEQFQVEAFEITIPATVQGILKYLSSGLIKGIGPMMAGRIVDLFGLNTIEVIEKTPERLSEVEGMGPKRVAMITEAWKEQREIKDIMIFLQGHGVSAAYSAKIYKQYGNQSIQMVRGNPYRLSQDIHGIGFITADRIAQHLGISPHSLIRAKAGLIYVLKELAEEGHVYYPETNLVQKAEGILKVEREIILQAMRDLSEEKEIFLETIDLKRDLKAVYLAPFYYAEAGSADRLKRLMEHPSNVRSIHGDKAIEWIEEKLKIDLAPRQKEAILSATCSKVLILTGGPGTGKTTIITAILRILQGLRLRILLAAPTGRAAKRMSEATGWEAKTIHRLLEYSPMKAGFKKDPENPLEADVVIIDEASMVDILLMYHLLKAIPSSAHLILVGDVDQLPSVGPGNVLKEMIDSGLFRVVRLTEIFRQAQKSAIVMNAHRIHQGEFPNLWGLNQKEGTDFYFVEEEEPEIILEKMVMLCTEEIPQRFGFHPIKEIQVLSPMHRGILGDSNLNLELQKRLNPEPTGIACGTTTFRLHDKVMQITNNYQKEVFNGDIGWISEIHQEDRELMIEFEGRLIPYASSELDEIALAYAISVHKSQGSEYPAVLLPLTTQHYLLLQRNLIYTAITRAKKLMILIGSKKALGIAIRHNKPQGRYTHLSSRLQSTPVPSGISDLKKNF
ncbi:MAG: recombinase RecD [Deltaproteobacteria bacterium RBG_16_48_10]|nr:MAG: recombinase RecD [Deltaproteobacteria bacterium RBG_16_48_10]